MKYSFFDRDLSWLSFNSRILDEVARPTLPLLERFRFLAIYSSNLDEFYRVRYPVIRALHTLKEKGKLGHQAESSNITVDLQATKNIINRQQDRFGKLFKGELVPALGDLNICFLYNEPLPEKILADAGDVFFNQILGYLQPTLLDDSGTRFFPENNKLYLLVILEGISKPRHVIVNVPSDQLKRFYEFESDHQLYIVFMDDIIRAHLSYLFPNELIFGSYAIKITRDASFIPEDDFGSDLSAMIERQLSKRDFGLVTRFMFDAEIPDQLLKKTLRYFEIDEDSAVRGGRYHNLAELSNLPVLGGNMAFKKWTPIASLREDGGGSIFERLLSKDYFIHTPYHAYDPVIRFFNEAANHPGVTHIYTTIYRIAENSRIGTALISAARNGKRVRVLVELKARFDEHNNLKWARQLQKAGVDIIYSENKQKVHAKVTLVRMAHKRAHAFYGLIATGNFHEDTAKHYTDITLLTARQDLLREVKTLFSILTLKKRPVPGKNIFSKLFVASFNLKERFIELICREIEHAKEGKKAEIFIKVNNLEERTLISKLYEASMAGVEVVVMVRSVCCIVPGVTGLSENIRVIRLVDRYLEHSRIFHFFNQGANDLYIGSSDWMNRNIYRRIEVCIPVLADDARGHILQCIEIWKNDNLQMVEINTELENIPIEPAVSPLQAQAAIYELLQTASQLKG